MKSSQLKFLVACADFGRCIELDLYIGFSCHCLRWCKGILINSLAHYSTVINFIYA